jgi:hypothetical protein
MGRARFIVPSILLVFLHFPCVGSKENRLSLDHLIGKQQKDPSDFVSPQTWSIFNVFGSPGQEAKEGELDESIALAKLDAAEQNGAGMPPAGGQKKGRSNKGGSSSGSGSGGSGGGSRGNWNGGYSNKNRKPPVLQSSRPEEEWLKIVEEDSDPAGAAGAAGAGGASGSTSSSLSARLPLHKSAASIGGLLPTRVYVINSDREVERWVQVSRVLLLMILMIMVMMMMMMMVVVMMMVTMMMLMVMID